ncbi:hypothetical protein E2C01_098832 [Portunus trituberculatus]|uniref:Uncharacterized protein n=1 Tax=Portunus trituberculatus TaxID=210409 RepID=A0A5B7K9E3_PORTR|nr:hypothetical protein [Portunus trituberculatus]
MAGNGCSIPNLDSEEPTRDSGKNSASQSRRGGVYEEAAVRGATYVPQL